MTETKRKRNSEEIETVQKTEENIKTKLRYSEKERCHIHAIKVGCYSKR